MVFGDSLSAAYGLEIDQGWVTLLKSKLRENYPQWQVSNVSISGETSSGGLARLPAALDRHQPDLVLLELGANDGLRGTPLKAIRNNFQQMLALLKERKIPVVLFEMQMPPNYGPAYTQRFNKIYHDLAKEYDVQLLPFFLDGVAGMEKLNQPDGIHPTAEAQPMLFANIWPVLDKTLKSL
ncbi:arylesterase [Parendozoicomonas haliclonae]|uniref:Esterase TesA n=1 Tax=Parendozoicomonas haliclonae TaxID=1960125 RepID=A0A1X7AFL2_9GAMM|nr:Esterase TesA precursor [Parendozoicomonas haliclonae]